eukprot:TRINITY_DN43501_c0_g1_i1.p1 TRINITY_DN43501_c0_g1~~TRINITY_DN43501_c0_g1_i1.p1  ORF type:complete len:768 (-),score=175.93 TRINITY_DN43501_c0_g1_i1:32-2335(-)
MDSAALPEASSRWRWVAGLQDGLQGLQQLHGGLQGLQGGLQGVLSKPDAAEEIDQETNWEEALQRQNAANDELVTANSSLQLQLEQLQLQEEADETKALMIEDPVERHRLSLDDTSEHGPRSSSSFEEELLQLVNAAVRQALAAGCAPDDAAGVAGDNTVSNEKRLEISDKVLVQLSQGSWEEEVVTAVKEAVRAALREEADSSNSQKGITAAEEVAFLVGEKMALREKVERQQERIELLENELRELGSMPPSNLGGMFSMARGLSDAGSVLTAGLSAVLAPQNAAVSKETVTVGGEYEIISGRGAIVRQGDSLRSDIITELPPGSRVRVVAVSTRYPRRVEILFIPRRDGEEAPSGPTSETCPDELSASLAGSGGRGVVGWISASSKDGRYLIRSIAPQAKEDVGGRAASNEATESTTADSQDEKTDDKVASVTVSSEEWECLNEANAAAVRRVAELTAQLTHMGRELLQAFEMRSVLAQLQKSVKRDFERAAALRERVAMSSEEMYQRHQAAALRRVQLAEVEVALQSVTQAAARHPVTSCSEESSSRAPEDHTDCSVASPSRQGGEQLKAIKAIDWDRLLSERETTAAALSAGLQRLNSLQREAEELNETERIASEGQSQGELVALKEKLRLRMFGPRPSELMQEVSAPLSPEAAQVKAASAGLLRRRAKDLRRTVQELRSELQLARDGEVVLRRSLSARSSALRYILFRGATAGLNLPQCGPISIPSDPAAIRTALIAAVEEQLHWNLKLRGLAEVRRTVSRA